MSGGSSEPGPSITAAVLSYDGRHLLEGLLPTLAAQTVAGLRIVVVDNGSSDGTADWLRSDWPQVAGRRAAPKRRRDGGAEPLRAGGERQRADRAAQQRHRARAGLPRPARRSARGAPGAGSAAPKLLDFHDRSVLDGAGDAFVWRGSATRRGHGERDSGQYDEPEAVFGACGGAALYRRSAFDRVGLFDESYFAFYEDVDWNLRAQLAGLGCRYVPSAVVYHMGSATIGAGLTDFTQYHLWRNALWLVLKDYPRRWLLRRAPDLLVGQLLVLAGALRTRQLGVWLRATRDGLRGAAGALGGRRDVRARRLHPPPDLSAVVGSTWSELRSRYLRPGA